MESDPTFNSHFIGMQPTIDFKEEESDVQVKQENDKDVSRLSSGSSDMDLDSVDMKQGDSQDADSGSDDEDATLEDDEEVDSDSGDGVVQSDEDDEDDEDLDVAHEEVEAGGDDSGSGHEDEDNEEAGGQPSRRGSTKSKGIAGTGANKQVSSNNEPTDGDGSEEESEVYNNPKCPELAIPAYRSLSKEITQSGRHMNAMIKRRDEITNDESGLFDQNMEQTILIELTNSISEYLNDLKVLRNARRALSRYI